MCTYLFSHFPIFPKHQRPGLSTMLIIRFIKRALGESLRAELAKQLDNCVKMTFERDAERIKSAHFVNQLKQLRDKGIFNDPAKLTKLVAVL